jgi:hypothetical protein
MKLIRLSQLSEDILKIVSRRLASILIVLVVVSSGNTVFGQMQRVNTWYLSNLEPNRLRTDKGNFWWIAAPGNGNATTDIYGRYAVGGSGLVIGQAGVVLTNFTAWRESNFTDNLKRICITEYNKLISISEDGLFIWSFSGDQSLENFYYSPPINSFSYNRRKLLPDSLGEFKNCAFTTINSGYVLLKNNTIYKTNDTGYTWQRIGIVPTISAKVMETKGSNSIFIAGESNEFIYNFYILNLIILDLLPNILVRPNYAINGWFEYTK